MNLRILAAVTAITSIALGTPSIDETELPLEQSVFTNYVELPQNSVGFRPAKIKVETKITVSVPEYEELKVAVKLPKPKPIKTQIKCLKCE